VTPAPIINTSYIGFTPFLKFHTKKTHQNKPEVYFDTSPNLCIVFIISQKSYCVKFICTIFEHNKITIGGII